MKTKAKFITFEGIDGCGKSTQAKLFYEWIKSQGYPVIFVREPGGTQVSEAVREILLNRINIELYDRTEALLMTASRAQLTKEVILTSLEKGTWVVTDRYADSTLAYQGGGRGLDVDWLKKVNDFATYSLQPDVTFFVDVTPEEGQKRRSGEDDRIERAGLKLQHKVRQQYLALIQEQPNRILSVDGMKSVDAIQTEIRKEIIRRFNISQ